MRNSKNHLLKVLVYSNVDDSKNKPFIVSLRERIFQKLEMKTKK